MGKKSIINAIVQIEKDSGSFDDSLLDQLKELDLDELKGILKDYDPGLTDQYTKKKSLGGRPKLTKSEMLLQARGSKGGQLSTGEKKKKLVKVKRGGMIKKFASGGAATRGFGKVIK
tara:strand:+ start:215 stop:565 length:351 start_codon:yes stop_codon:yes gene_type:complete